MSPRALIDAGGGRRTSAACRFGAVLLRVLAALVLVVAGVDAQDTGDGKDSKEEEVDAIDPYTRGESRALDEAGYVSLGPFPLAEGIHTRDLGEVLGGIPVRWVETAHFRIGSTLKTYRYTGDQREEKKIKAECARLAKKLARCRQPRNEIDPWLRLHLYAQRVEEQYADFLERFGFTDADFVPPAGAKPRAGTPAYMGEGPYLGQEHKLVVLLFEKPSALGRFANRHMKTKDTASLRECLPGGAMVQGTSAQAWLDNGYTLDATLHAVVAADLAHNLVDGFRKSWFSAPTWFKVGLSHWYARRADERFAVYATGATRDLDDESWRWEPRLRGLVLNDGAPPWKDMLAWQDANALKPHEHMTAWSRVDWMLGLDDADLRGFLIANTESLASVATDQRPAHVVARCEKSLEAAFGKSVERLDEAWRKHVVLRYPKD